MSSTNEDLIREVLEEFTSALQLKLPLGHFSQFYEDTHFDNLSQHEAKQILASFQASSKLNMNETFAAVSELFPKLQDVIREWKVKMEENKTKCDQVLQSQVDFLLADFRTSVFIKLVSAPDVGLQDLETFLEGRKIVLTGIFEKLSKPGEPQSSVNMKTSLVEKLECVKLETLEKQRLHLEKNAAHKAKKVLEDTKGIIMEKARQLQSELRAYQGKYPKDLVKATLVDINKYLSKKGKKLEARHPQIYSAVLRSTAEVRNCLDEEDYNDMTAEEFAETLHEQLLYDFAGENHVGVSANAIGLDSISSSDASASEFSGNGEEEALLTAPNPNEICNRGSDSQQNELQIDFAEEARMKQEKGDNEMDLGTSEMVSGNSNNVASLIQSVDHEQILVQEGENEMEESTTPSEYKMQSGGEKPNKSSKHVPRTRSRNTHGNISSRRSVRLLTSSKAVAPKNLRQKRRCVVMRTNQARNNAHVNESSASSRDDSNEEENDPSPPKRFEACFSSSKPNRRKLHQAGRHRSSEDQGADKITYLYLKAGIPTYFCNVCKRRCRQNWLKYHGSNCGKIAKPFTCYECGQGFHWKSHFEIHSRIHSGEKPYKCPKCSERFAVRSNLYKHMRCHDDRTRARIVCKSCKMSFISRRRLHDHNNSFHKDKRPFSCRYCDGRFAFLTSLKKHVICHADFRPFKCTICDASVCTKYYLARHFQTVHSHSKATAEKLANDVAVAYLVMETKDESFRDIPQDRININSLVVSHIIKKANLKLPKRATRRTNTSQP